MSVIDRTQQVATMVGAGASEVAATMVAEASELAHLVAERAPEIAATAALEAGSVAVRLAPKRLLFAVAIATSVALWWRAQRRRKNDPSDDRASAGRASGEKSAPKMAAVESVTSRS